MYPRQFLDSFWSPEIRNQVFVALSFDELFLGIFKEMIEPACNECNIPPLLINNEKSGDSIITKILDGIAHSKLIIVEISSTRENDSKSRNGNVMWEVGVAHSFRQPDEVILLRYDSDHLLFDIGPIRVHKYNNQDLNGARKDLTALINDRLNAIEYQKSMLVDRALNILDPGALNTLLSKVPFPYKTESFEIKPTMGNQLLWPKLFELGIIAFDSNIINKKTIKEAQKGNLTVFSKFRVTQFGLAVLDRLIKKIDSGII